jgi:hypothetical protein
MARKRKAKKEQGVYVHGEEFERSTVVYRGSRSSGCPRRRQESRFDDAIADDGLDRW